jgi:hypothetical protein
MTCTRGQRHQQSIANTAMHDSKNVNAISMMITIAGGTKNMNNLYDRLKPEYKAKLEEEAEFYPNSIRAIEQELKRTTSFIDLKYGTVFELSNFLILYNYDLSTIDNLFEQS